MAFHTLLHPIDTNEHKQVKSILTIDHNSQHTKRCPKYDSQQTPLKIKYVSCLKEL